jgi:hypothetical protein
MELPADAIPILRVLLLHQGLLEAALLSTLDGSFQRGPRLFFTSAKTGEGVEDVFGCVVNRMVGR